MATYNVFNLKCQVNNGFKFHYYIYDSFVSVDYINKIKNT